MPGSLPYSRHHRRRSLVFGEATDGDGDENSSRDNTTVILKDNKKHDTETQDEIKRFTKRRLYWSLFRQRLL